MPKEYLNWCKWLEINIIHFKHSLYQHFINTLYVNFSLVSSLLHCRPKYCLREWPNNPKFGEQMHATIENKFFAVVKLLTMQRVQWLTVSISVTITRAILVWVILPSCKLVFRESIYFLVHHNGHNIERGQPYRHYYTNSHSLSALQRLMQRVYSHRNSTDWHGIP